MEMYVCEYLDWGRDFVGKGVTEFESSAYAGREVQRIERTLAVYV